MKDETEQLDELALYAIDQIAEGHTLQTIAEALGMTAGGVFRRCTRTKELQRRYWLARETATDLLESEMIETARTAKDAKMARVRVSTLQWIIEKRDPHRYGQQLRLAHTSPDGSMSPKGAIDPGKLSDEALAELMAARNAQTEE